MNGLELCRLCLYNNNEELYDIYSDKLCEKSMLQKIKKYFNLNITTSDKVRIICSKCLEKIENFHTFYEEVSQNQEMLLYSQTTEPPIEPPIENLGKPDTNQDFIKIEITGMDVNGKRQMDSLNDSDIIYTIEAVNVQSDIAKEENLDDEKVTVILKSETEKPLPRKKLTRKAQKNLMLQVPEESDGSDSDGSIFEQGSGQKSDDYDSDENDGLGHDGNNTKYPDKLIQDTRLLIKGKRLMNLMSRFYRLECDLCVETTKRKPIFKRLSELCKHYTEVHTIKGYVLCCGVKLVKIRAMAMHMSRHLQPDAFKCPICDKMMTCPKILQYHIQNHLPEEQRPLACPECPRRFSYSSAMVAHSISHQPENEREHHVCDECGKTFNSPGRLSTHINVVHTRHDQVYVCHMCAKQFGCKSNLVYHLTTHQPRMHQVQCEQCGKWLKNKLCLRKHMVQHSSVRFQCHLCDYSALNRQCLRNHSRVQHSDVKPFSCEICGKSFKLKNTLMNHTVQHTGVRKFACQFCTRTFASSGNFYSHRKRMHPQELAAFKFKQEEEERVLREKALAVKVE